MRGEARGEAGHEVALKVLRPELSEALGRERFLREVHPAAGLTRPAARFQV